MGRITDTLKRIRGDSVVGDARRKLHAQNRRLKRLVVEQGARLERIEQLLLDQAAAPTKAPPGRLSEDPDSWKNVAQPGELSFHKRKNDRSEPYWEKLNAELWTRFGFEADGWAGKLIVDIGAGSRLRTLYFNGASIAAVEPLAEQFMAEVEWHDLDQAEEIYALPGEQEIPELLGRADLLVSINALDHGFSFEESVRNVRKYLKPNGLAFLSFDQHHTPDDMHPLVLNDEIVRGVLERCDLSVEKFTEEGRYHGGPGPRALNYWLRPA